MNKPKYKKGDCVWLPVLLVYCNTVQLCTVQQWYIVDVYKDPKHPDPYTNLAYWVVRDPADKADKKKWCHLWEHDVFPNEQEALTKLHRMVLDEESSTRSYLKNLEKELEYIEGHLELPM